MDHELILGVGPFEHREDSVEGVVEVGRVRDRNGISVIAVETRRDGAIGVKNFGRFVVVLGPGNYVETFQAGRANEIHINDERPDFVGLPIAAKVVELEVRNWSRRAVEELGNSCMPVEVAALGLIFANFGQFSIGINRLVGAGAEQHFRRPGQFVAQKQPESHGSAALQG